MSDFNTTMERFSENNRLTFPQYTMLAARFQERYGVSSFRAMKMVAETLTQRQKVLDEQAKQAGGQPYVPPSKRSSEAPGAPLPAPPGVVSA